MLSSILNGQRHRDCINSLQMYVLYAIASWDSHGRKDIIPGIKYKVRQVENTSQEYIELNLWNHEGNHKTFFWYVRYGLYNEFLMIPKGLSTYKSITLLRKLHCRRYLDTNCFTFGRHLYLDDCMTHIENWDSYPLTFFRLRKCSISSLML